MARGVGRRVKTGVRKAGFSGYSGIGDHRGECEYAAMSVSLAGKLFMDVSLSSSLTGLGSLACIK